MSSGDGWWWWRRAMTANGRDVRLVYAGIDTYEKRDGAWTRVANVSPFGEE
jgi:hypothetical protein